MGWNSAALTLDFLLHMGMDMELIWYWCFSIWSLAFLFPCCWVNSSGQFYLFSYSLPYCSLGCCWQGSFLWFGICIVGWTWETSCCTSLRCGWYLDCNKKCTCFFLVDHYRIYEWEDLDSSYMCMLRNSLYQNIVSNPKPTHIGAQMLICFWVDTMSSLIYLRWSHSTCEQSGSTLTGYIFCWWFYHSSFLLISFFLFG